jgi:hypothetical protein
MLTATTTSCPCFPRCDCVPWREPAWSRCGCGARLLTRLFDPCRPGWSRIPACPVLWARCAHHSTAWVAAAEPLVHRRAAAHLDWAAPTTVNPLRHAHRACAARCALSAAWRACRRRGPPGPTSSARSQAPGTRCSGRRRSTWRGVRCGPARLPRPPAPPGTERASAAQAEGEALNELREGIISSMAAHDKKRLLSPVGHPPRRTAPFHLPIPPRRP